MRGVPGRKNVLWVGDGFPPVNMSDVGRTTANEISTRTCAISPASCSTPASRCPSPAQRSKANSSARHHARHNPIRDMMSSGGYDGLNISQGGIAFSGLCAAHRRTQPTRTATIWMARSPRASPHGSSYYTLSYRPTNPSNNPKAYRRIRVTVTRPGLTVQTRNGYFEEPAQTATLRQNSHCATRLRPQRRRYQPPRLHRPSPYSRA